MRSEVDGEAARLLRGAGGDIDLECCGFHCVAAIAPSHFGTLDFFDADIIAPYIFSASAEHCVAALFRAAISSRSISTSRRVPLNFLYSWISFSFLNLTPELNFSIFMRR